MVVRILFYYCYDSTLNLVLHNIANNMITCWVQICVYQIHAHEYELHGFIQHFFLGWGGGGNLYVENFLIYNL